MKILIVGSSGYVGSNLITFYACDSTNEIYGISRRLYSNPKLMKNFVGDVSNLAFLTSIDMEFDLIINCVAKTEHFGIRGIFYRDNVQTVKNLLSVFNRNFKCFIHISSEAVFLNGKISYINDSTPLPSKNISDYAWSKRVAEMMVNDFNSERGSKIIIIRPRLIWGGDRSIVFEKLKTALEKKIFFYVDKGDYLTSSTHIRNLFKGINCAFKYGKNKQAYFITDGAPIKFKKLIVNVLDGKMSEKAISLPRWLVYPLCLLGDFLKLTTFGLIKIPLSRSLYYLTFSEVVVDGSITQKSIHYKPEPISRLINEYHHNQKN